MPDNAEPQLPCRAMTSSGALEPTLNYVVLCNPRSGSNMLIQALREHPSLRAYGEIFQDEREARENAYRGEYEYYTSDKDGAWYVRKLFQQCYFDQILSIGFKLFFEQARSSPAKTVWDYIVQEQGIKIIHLTRACNLEAYVSLCEAQQSGQWVLDLDQTPDRNSAPVHIDIDACLGFLNDCYAHSSWVRSTFADRPFLEIEYKDDLCENFSLTMQAVQTFLNVPVIDLPLVTVKQAQRPVSQRVSNYVEVFEALKRSPFASMLNDPS